MEKVASQLDHSFFYIEKLTPSHLFPDENLYFLNNRESEVPWISEGKFVPKLVADWEKIKTDLQDHFHSRQFALAKPLMIRALSGYLKLLFWTNNKPVCLTNLAEEIDQLTIKPTNISDRLEFIMENPSLHLSFIQLGELFIEQQKKYSKNLVMKKRASSKSC